MKRFALAGIVATVCVMVLSLTAMSQIGSKVKSPHKKLSRPCEACHVSASFKEVRFKHESTRFPLEGHHEKTDCLLCHSIEEFSKVTKECQGCHSDVHMGRLGEQCSECHSPQGWTAFDASEVHSRSDFPLMGRHVLVDCKSCHAGQTPDQFDQTASDCIACHQQDYLDVTDPDHVGNGFSTQCDECHDPTTWRPGRMPDHDVFFPIFSGAHRGEWDGCVTCHSDPGNKSLFTCLGCHAHEEQPMSEVHGGLDGYAYDSGACYGCHPTGDATTFVEHDTQFFPIYSGTHNATWDNCAVCHTDPGNRSSYTCLQCHEHEQTAMDTHHNGFAGYSYTSDACLSCHPTGEAGAFDDHDAEFFPIYSGTHNATWDNCAVCHTDPGNRSLFTCLQCHEHEQTAMDTRHNGFAGYSYTSDACLSCHPTGEAGAFVNHDAEFFPIYSGTHNATWDNCVVCHTDPGNRSLFTCLQCHEHEQTAMDTHHNGFPGYSYTSDACLSCHPTGEAGTFVDHDADFFPIFSGVHNGAWSDCATCHTTPSDRHIFSCVDCHTHERTITDASHPGIPGYAYDSVACYGCHPAGTADPFVDHDALFFPIYSGAHNSRWDNCATCHEDPAQPQLFTCFNCHEHSQALMDERHRNRRNYTYDSNACLECHPRGK